MNTISELDKRILENKIKILKFILNIFLTINLLVLLFYLAYFFYDYKLLLDRNIPVYIVASMFFFMLLLLLRNRLSLKSINLTLYLLTSILTLISLSLFLLSGTGVIIAAVLILFLVSVISIIDSVWAARNYLIIVIAAYLLIFVIHQFSDFKYVPDTTASTVSSTFIFVMMSISFGYVAKLGYSEIENSYSEAIRYAKKLEILNKELDSRVQARTKRLTDNFNRNSETLYKAALVGGITRPLLHDIATPVSALKGSIDLLKAEKFKDKEILNILEESTNQIDTIINDSRELIRGNDITTVFTVKKTINKIVKIISSEFHRNDIKIIFDCNDDYYLRATQSLFERCILNLLLNAMEELVQKQTSDKKVKIITYLEDSDSTGVVEIIDNGRGIPQNVITNIFKENFSQKNTTDNLGLGLPFVKDTIEKKLKGIIEVESVLGQFTKFTIKLNVFKEDTQHNQ